MSADRWQTVRILLLASVCGSCSSNEAALPDGARGVVQTASAQFQRMAAPTPNQPPEAPRKEPFFAAPWRAAFAVGADGTLQASAGDEAPPALPGVVLGSRGPASPQARGAQRLATRFPATAAGALRVEVEATPGARASSPAPVWVEERLVGGASTARAEVVDGRVVYAGGKPGLDRVYEVSAQRVEEYLRLADAHAAADVRYEIVAGPGIADLVVDGSGFGLVAVDAAGKPVPKAPQPTGVDARGEPVQGRLVATRVGAGRFTVRLELSADASCFPLLLDPSWVSTGSMSFGATPTPPRCS